MQTLKFNLEKEYIELNKLLKILSIVNSGGQANSIISNGLVYCNGQVDRRKRLKLRKGDVIKFSDTLINIC